MRPLFRSAFPVLLGLTAFAAQASDFGPLLSVTQRTWPEKNHIGVVCNYEASKDQVQAMAAAAAPGSVITVVDARRADQVSGARVVLSDRKADYLVLLPRDPVFYEGSFASTLLVHRMAAQGIPAVGTSPLALKQGAVFAIGEGTKGELMVTDRLTGTVSVILPNRSASLGTAYPTRAGNGVTLQILSAPN